MRKKIHTRKCLFPEAQVTSEFAILIAVIIAALVAMSTYMKRSMAAHLKDAMDYPLYAAGSNFTTNQYEPDYYSSDSLSNQSFTSDRDMARGGGVTVSSTAITSSEMTEIINGTE